MWLSFPFRYIERYYLLAQRHEWGFRLFLARMAGCKVEDPDWMEDGVDTVSTIKAASVVSHGGKKWKRFTPDMKAERN